MSDLCVSAPLCAVDPEGFDGSLPAPVSFLDDYLGTIGADEHGEEPGDRDWRAPDSTDELGEEPGDRDGFGPHISDC